MLYYGGALSSVPHHSLPGRMNYVPVCFIISVVGATPERCSQCYWQKGQCPPQGGSHYKLLQPRYTCPCQSIAAPPHPWLCALLKAVVREPSPSAEPCAQHLAVASATSNLQVAPVPPPSLHTSRRALPPKARTTRRVFIHCQVPHISSPCVPVAGSPLAPCSAPEIPRCHSRV